MESNNQTFLGRLGRNPELRYTKKQEPICHLSVAVNSETGETNWKRVVVWGKQAEQCSVHLSKGIRIFVQGKGQLKSFVNQNGETKSYEEVSANIIGFTHI